MSEHQAETATPIELEDAGQGTLLERPRIGGPDLELEPEPIAAPAVIEGPATREPTIAEAAMMAPVAIDPLAMLASALDAGHDVTKLERLFDLAERYEEKQARMAFAGALSDFQGDVAQIVETKQATVTMTTGGSYTYYYADLDVIMRTIRPTLKACGLSVRYDAEVSDDGARIRSTCYVMHRGGHTEVTTFVVPLDEGMKVNDSQKMGSANSYACRYNVVNALGLTTGEDDDGSSLDDKGDDVKRRSSATAAPVKPGSALETHCPIGKHKGDPWDQVPLDYLEWMVANLTDKPDIVGRAQEAMADRMANMDADPKPEDTSGEPTMAECARSITKATTVAELEEIWTIVPSKHRDGLEGFYSTRVGELGGAAPKNTGDDNPF